MNRRLTDEEILNIPVEVPVSWAKDAPINHAWEKMQILSLPLIIDNLLVRPPSLGVWTILELIDAKKFVMDAANMSALDLARVLYINEFRERAASEFNLWLIEDIKSRETGTTKLDKKVIRWFEEFAESATSVESIEEILGWFATSWNGFSMLPDKGSSNSEADWFGAVRLGGIIAACADKMSVSYEDILWKTPLCAISHTIAQVAVMNGEKRVARKKDEEDVKEWMAKAKICIAEGKLLPWQEKYPMDVHLSEHQIKYGGAQLAVKLTELKEGLRSVDQVIKKASPKVLEEALERIKRLRAEK